MNEDKNITKNEMRFFQNDMLIDLKKLELQITSKITKISQKLSTKINEYDSKFTKIFEIITELVSKVTARKYDNERIEELLSIKNKFSEQIFENQTRISIIDKTLENSIFKYDKMIIDNLQVPGIIGIGCAFKNCRLFFESVYNEIKLNQKNKEQEQSILKTFQEKIDSRIFKIENELNKIHLNINQNCDSKFERYFAQLEERTKVTEEMVQTSKIENSKYAIDLIKTSTSLQIEWERLENIKNEINEKFQEELEIFKKIVDSVNKNYSYQDNELKTFKQKFTQFSKYIKDLDFKKQQKQNIREISKNIDIKNQKITKNNNNTENNNEIINEKGYIKSPSPSRNRGKYILNELENKKAKETLSNASNSIKKDKNDKNKNLNPKNRKNSLFNEYKNKDSNNLNIDVQITKNNKIPEKKCLILILKLIIYSKIII